MQVIVLSYVYGYVAENSYRGRKGNRHGLVIIPAKIIGQHGYCDIRLITPMDAA